MFYNYSLAGYFILLFVAFVATLNGLMILKTRTFEMPFGSGERVEGTAAVVTDHSTRGTALDGNRLERDRPTPLRDGMRLDVGARMRKNHAPSRPIARLRPRA